MKLGYGPEFREDEKGVVWFKNRICVPANSALRKEILSEAHDSKYCLHPGGSKMYQDVKKHYWWKNMKADIARHVAECDICNRVKAKHQRPTGLLKPLEVPEWKWGSISMDFIVGLPRSQGGHDSIWVVVDRLTKAAHFVPCGSKIRTEQLADLYVKHILRLHGAPTNIISDRGAISCLDSGNHFMSPLEPSLIIAQRITRRLTGRQRG